MTPDLAAVVRAALASAGLPEREPTFERPRQREHGDWATNVALTLAGPVGRAPREIAEEIVTLIGSPPGVDAVEVAGPGFINFRLASDAFADIVRTAVTAGSDWGHNEDLAGQRINVEFVSANPTGPIHVGHGRQAALGDAVASLLEACGAQVTREYYFNDAGEQMRLFGDSVAAAITGDEPPSDGYRGAYIAELAAALTAQGDVPADVGEAAYEAMLARITATLERFGVDFDVFFGERSLHRSGAVAEAIADLRGNGYVYDEGGAVWLATTRFGDDKDRVLLKAGGVPTYFAADCAYLRDKAARGFDHLIYVLGADHHGYIGRMHAVADAAGVGREVVEIVIHQFVNLYRDGEAVRMSKRTGEIITFDELIDEVGADAARYTLLRFSPDTTIDFDIAEVVRAEKDNPVYYVQYSSARIAGIMRTATEKGLEPGTVADAPLGLLADPAERELIRRIGRWPEVVALAAAERAPHRVARYAEDLAEAFHKFYTDCQVVGVDAELSLARYWLVVAARQTLAGALGLLGVDAPERM